MATSRSNGKHRKGHKPKARPAPKGRHGHCSCGEKERLRSVTLAVDGKAVGKWRLCRTCTAIVRMSALPPAHSGWRR